MKKLIIFVFCLLIISCGCGHKDGEHVSNDTIKCILLDKFIKVSYDIVLDIPESKKIVKIQNINTNNIRKIENNKIYNNFNIGDTILMIEHYCPYSYIEFVNYDHR